MNLSSFKALVDDGDLSIEDGSPQIDEESVSAQIRKCFTPSESDQALRDIRELITNLGVRYMCDDCRCEPFLQVAEAIRSALRSRGTSAKSRSDWVAAIVIAKRHAGMPMHREQRKMKWGTDIRVSTLSHAVMALRADGYRIEFPSEGGVDLSTGELKRLADDIHVLAMSLGGAVAFSAAAAMESRWNASTGRFKLGRSGETVPIGALPEVPIAYLYQLGLRYFGLTPTAKNPEATLNKLTKLLASATGLLDLVADAYELLFARAGDLISILRMSMVYDSVYLVTQAKVAHVREYVEWMMRHSSFATLSSKTNASSDQVLSLALMLLDKCNKVKAWEFCLVEVQAAAFAANLNVEPADRLLQEIFCHTAGANQNLTFPPQDMDVDAAFRPLVILNGDYFLQPPPLAARAILNAIMDWCRNAWPNKKFDEQAVGPMFEEFVRYKLTARGVTVHYGKYKLLGIEGECDAALATDKELIFLELKSKMLRREGKSGNDLVALSDLGQALVRPQAQAMERHAAMVKVGSLSLQTNSGESILSLAAREVLKVSVTRGDLGSLHDRPFLQQFLKAGSISRFDAIDPSNQTKLNDLGKWFNRLKAAAVAAGEADFRKSNPYSRSWSLSLFQLLMLLEHTSDNDSFSNELQRTRWIITSMRDFYEEYAYARQHLGKGVPTPS
jgi:hypothetical protein